MKLTTTLVCALTVLAFSTGAWAENDDWAETTDLAEEVDWEEAIEFAEVTDTFVENGVKWVTYYDELQQVMWSQPEDASSEAALAYLSGDQETLKDMGLDYICIINWPVPNKLTFYDGDGTWYNYFNSDFILYSSSSTSRNFYTDISETGLTGIDGYVDASVRNSISYCNNYQNRLFDSDQNMLTPSISSCTTLWGTTYYRAYEDDVDDWSYPVGAAYYVSRHRFYACDAQRYVRLMVSNDPA